MSGWFCTSEAKKAFGKYTPVDWCIDAVFAILRVIVVVGMYGLALIYLFAFRKELRRRIGGDI